jgi:hypothetical protein
VDDDMPALTSPADERTANHLRANARKCVDFAANPCVRGGPKENP